MTDASKGIYNFVCAAVVGICDHEEDVQIVVCERDPKTSSIYIHCHSDDLRFVYGKIRELKVIAIAIARKYGVTVNLFVEE